MGRAQLDPGIILMRLYRIFRIREEDFSTTTKLLYIYEWLEPTAGEATLDLITDLRQRFRAESNARTIDALYTELKLISIKRRGICAPATTEIPINQERVTGWKL